MSNYQNKQSNIRKLKTPTVEVFDNIYSDKKYSIHIENPEFTAVCPKTGLPDFGTIEITYSPKQYCLELKSLKEYFMFFRDIGIFHENVVNKALEDLVRAVKPRSMKIKAVYKPRGGIITTVVASYKKKK